MEYSSSFSRELAIDVYSEPVKSGSHYNVP